MLAFGLLVIASELVLSAFFVRDTLPWVHSEAKSAAAKPLSTWEVFTLMSWRDLGYAIGALGFALTANLTGQIEVAFWFVAVSMLASGVVLLIWGEETRPL